MAKTAVMEKRPTEASKAFLKIIQDWQFLEDDTIRFSEDMLKKSKNPLVRMTMEMIRSDSKKHKAMQQMLIDSITKEAVHLSPDELAAISDSLNKHIAAEQKSLELADEALKHSELFITRFILKMLIADETKHHNVLGDLNELKRKTILVT
jgi:rubrerythrin